MEKEVNIGATMWEDIVGIEDEGRGGVERVRRRIRDEEGSSGSRATRARRRGEGEECGWVGKGE